MYPKQNYSELSKALYDQIEFKELSSLGGKTKVMFTLGKLKNVAHLSNCLESITPDEDKARVFEYVCRKKKQELVWDALFLIFGKDFRLYEVTDVIQ